MMRDIWWIQCLVQDCSISRALAVEILQSCTKPLKWCMYVLLGYWKCLLLDGFVQDCNNSCASAMELLQSFTKPSIILIFWTTQPVRVTTPGAETGTFQDNKIKTMAADALAPCAARMSASMILTMQVKQALAFKIWGVQQPTPSHSQCLEIIENAIIFSCFPK